MDLSGARTPLGATRSNGPSDIFSSTPPTKRRRLSGVGNSPEAPIDLDGADVEVAPSTAVLASPRTTEAAPKIGLFLPSPSPELTTQRPRRLELVQRPLPPCPPLPGRPKSDLAQPCPGVESEDEEDAKVAGYEPSCKERTWHATPAWWGHDDIFPRARETRSVTPTSSPGQLDLNFSHDAPHTRRWAALAPELELHSFNPPRPPPRMLFTHRSATRWLVKEERCVDIDGGDAINRNLSVWSKEELAAKRAVPYRHAWHDTKGRTKPLDETLPGLLDRVL